MEAKYLKAPKNSFFSNLSKLGALPRWVAYKNLACQFFFYNNCYVWFIKIIEGEGISFYLQYTRKNGFRIITGDVWIITGGTRKIMVCFTALYGVNSDFYGVGSKNYSS